MLNFNRTKNSSESKKSEKIDDKFDSKELSLDDILTYSDEPSQNQSYKKIEKIANFDKITENKNYEKPIPIINSFNSEVAMSFFNAQNDQTKKFKEYISKSPVKFSKKEDNLEYKALIKSCINLKIYKIGLSELSHINDNVKDISGFKVSLSNLLSGFEIKDISISRSLDANSKNNNSEKKNLNDNHSHLDNLSSIKSANIFNKSNKDNSNRISTPLILSNSKINKNSEDHSNTNSMCNYQNNLDINEHSDNKDDDNKEKKNKNLEHKKKVRVGIRKKELNLKLDLSIDDLDDNKFKTDTKKYHGILLEENVFIQKDNFVTSNKKELELNFQQQNNNKTIKKSIKYTKAQCVNILAQNIIDENQLFFDNKNINQSDNPIKTKDTTSAKNSHNKKNKK